MGFFAEVVSKLVFKIVPSSFHADNAAVRQYEYTFAAGAHSAMRLAAHPLNDLKVTDHRHAPLCPNSAAPASGKAPRLFQSRARNRLICRCGMGACRTTRSLCAIEIFVFARTLAANARQPQVVEGPNFSHWAFCKSPRKTEVTFVMSFRVLS